MPSTPITEVQPLPAGSDDRPRQWPAGPEIRAIGVQYLPIPGHVAIDLVNGCRFSFPVQVVAELRNRRDSQLAAVEIDRFGFNLRWPALALELYVPALLAGIFGARPK